MYVLLFISRECRHVTFIISATTNDEWQICYYFMVWVILLDLLLISSCAI